MAGEAGIVGANLVIVLAFALYAVIQLSRVTLAAQQIDSRVKTIIGEVGPIDTDLDEVAKLDETNRIAADILTAAKPLSGQADQILTAAKSIDGTVSLINGNAGEINGTVDSIHATVTNLAPVVNDIHDRVARINNQADTVIGSVNGIQSDLNNVLLQVGGLNSRTTDGKFNIDGHANSIECNFLVNGGLLAGLGSSNNCDR